MKSEVALAEMWCTPAAEEVARKIAKLHGTYCGPAAVVWIAAVWNVFRRRPYDYLARLDNKNFFPDGPRMFQYSFPGFQMNLNDLLMRETNNELMLSKETYYKYSEIHHMLMSSGMPLIIRIPSMSLKDGLHYVTLFQSELTPDSYRFHWQDNGVFHSDERLPEGLSLAVRKLGDLNFFLWGAQRVVHT